jgi:hypothetical protein
MRKAYGTYPAAEAVARARASRTDYVPCVRSSLAPSWSEYWGRVAECLRVERESLAQSLVLPTTWKGGWK